MKTLEEIKVEFGRKFTFLNDLNQYKVGYRNRNGDDCMFGPQKVWNYIESTILQTKQNKDYVVVESQEVANDLIKNYKGKSLQRKWVVVAPKGIKEVSINELLKLPQIKEIVSQTKQELIEEIKEWSEYRRKNITGASVIESGKVLDKGSLFYDGYNQTIDELEEFLQKLSNK